MEDRNDAAKPKTKKAKQAKIAKVLREFKSGKLTSGGKPVSNYKQAVAIALSSAGMSLPKKDASEEYMKAFIRQVLQEEEEMEEEEEGEEETDRGDSESFSPPSSVRAAARRGLELRKKHGKGGLTTQEAGKQGIGSGVARAGDLAGGGSISFATIKRMAAFFSRHEKNKSGGEDDAGYIAWQLWGGDAGRSWASRIIKMVESRQSKQ
jgi:hypothetical protein